MSMKSIKPADLKKLSIIDISDRFFALYLHSEYYFQDEPLEMIIDITTMYNLFYILSVYIEVFPKIIYDLDEIKRLHTRMNEFIANNKLNKRNIDDENMLRLLKLQVLNN